SAAGCPPTPCRRRGWSACGWPRTTRRHSSCGARPASPSTPSSSPPRRAPPRSCAGSLTRVIAGLDHVQVAAPPGCEAEARAFYGRLLGLAELEKPPALAARGGAWFACGAQQLHVGVAADFTPATKAHPALAVTG